MGPIPWDLPSLVHTPEPNPIRAVVLRHDQPGDAWHHDLLLERPPRSSQAAADPDDRRLIAFRVAPPPHEPATTRAEATRLPDHRALYLDYEGPLTRGRGAVRRLATGRVRSLHEAPSSIAAAIDFPQGSVALQGERVEEDRWNLRFDWCAGS